MSDIKNTNNANKKFIQGVIFGIIIAIVLNIFVSNINLIYRKVVSKNLTNEQKITEIESVIDKYYMGDYSEEFMEEMMYKGIVASLQDPYSYYMSKDEFQSFIQDAEGNYVGIGIMINLTEDEKMNINKIFEGSPAQEAGLKIGDKIIEVEGETITALNYQDIVTRIKGEEGSAVTLTISRDNKTMNLDITRKSIEVPTVEHKMLQDNIGYISIAQFDRVTYNQFKKAFDELASAKGLIIDLRNNPGGYLTVVNEITDMLVPEGTITYIEDKNGNKEYHYSDENHYGKPLTILVNENSASASEVLSGAVKDFGVGELVGKTTFGKGIVQNMYTLSDGSGVKVTIAKYYTPNGICINGTGISPDYEVDNTEDLSVDFQLEKAIEVINNY